MIRYMLMIQEIAQTIISTYIKMELCNGQPTVAGCNFYNKLLTYVKQIRNSCLFKWKLKELLMKRCF